VLVIHVSYAFQHELMVIQYCESYSCSTWKATHSKWEYYM